MIDEVRKKSPRAPTMALDEAIERALKVYEKERRHPAPVDAVANAIGYKAASSGSALQALASLRYYGLLERPKDGHLAATKDMEAYQFAPSEDLRGTLRVRWLRTPPLFAELLDHYQGGLPSDATLRFDLIQRGFLPGTAESVISVFRRSVDFARYYEQAQQVASKEVDMADNTNEGILPSVRQEASQAEPAVIKELEQQVVDADKIPVRLSGGRRAWLTIPTPFYAADKNRLKAQIDLLLTDDEEVTDPLS